MRFQRLCSKAYYKYWWPKKYGHTIKQRLDFFRQNEAKDLKEIEEFRWSALKRILSHAEKHVPYYRNVFRENQLQIVEINDYPSFTKIPLLQRSNLQNNLEELVAENIDRHSLRRSSTGGSTGIPTPFFHDREYEKQNAALIYRNLFWTGWRFGQPIVKIWGSVADLTTQQKVTEKATNYLKGVTVFPAYKMSAENILEWAQEIRRVRPYLVEGYAQVLATFARYCQKAGVRLDDVGIQAVTSTAEMLYPQDRKLLEKTFACRIYNRYGHRELSTIAQECQYGNMHTNEDWLFVEIVDENGQPVQPGEIGQVVVTGFYNDGMPFIRYATQDLAVMAEPETACPCGRHFRILQQLQGRVQDLIVLPDGGVISGVFFPALLKYYDIVQFQVVQPSVNSLEISLIPGDHFSESDLQKIGDTVDRYFRGIECHYHFVDAIPVPPSGKHRYTLSHVSNPGWSNIVSM